MKHTDYHTVIRDLRARRTGVYLELATMVGGSRERDLVGRASDLLLAEEILLEQMEDEEGEADRPGPQGADMEGGEGPDYAAWERSGDWEHLGGFRRLPHGGVLVDYRTGGEIFVPEAVIRNEAVEHGDVLGARAKDTGGRREIYYFKVLDRRDRAGESDRLSFIAPLELRAGRWGARCENEDAFIPVPDADVAGLNLGEGDLVEVGYYAGDPASARVAWKFDPDDAFLQLRALRQAPRKTRDRDSTRAEPQELADTTVLVVGADAYKETFKRVFERRGAVFTWESGFMVGKFLESKVRRADIVVIVTEAMKHKMPDVEAVCARHGKPYVYAPSRGASGALREVLKMVTSSSSY